jgi:hypothetical protein
MNNTPITDAHHKAWGGRHTATYQGKLHVAKCVPIEFAQKLEHDQTELIKLAERAMDLLSEMGACETDEWVSIHSSIEKIKQTYSIHENPKTV